MSDMEMDSNFDTSPEPEVKQPEPQAPVAFYYLATLTVLYLRDGKLKQRLMNIRLELMAPHVNAQALNDCQRAAIGRIMQELNLKAEDIKDIVINNISFLGAMTKDIFENVTPTIIDGGQAPTEQAEDVAAPQGVE